MISEDKDSSLTCLDVRSPGPSKDKPCVHHASRGELPVVEREGCPQISRRLALQLIEELELVKRGMKKKKKKKSLKKK